MADHNGFRSSTACSPRLTGWASLVKDTGRDFAAFPKRPSTWVLIGIGAAGALAAIATLDSGLVVVTNWGR